MEEREERRREKEKKRKEVSPAPTPTLLLFPPSQHAYQKRDLSLTCHLLSPPNDGYIPSFHSEMVLDKVTNYFI